MPGITLKPNAWPGHHLLPTLPVEIWDRIVAPLSPKDARSLGAVNKLFNRRYWTPEKAMYRVSLAELLQDEWGLEYAQWVFLESRARQALHHRLVLPDPKAPNCLAGEPGAFEHLVKLEFEVFLGEGGGGEASKGFDQATFVKDICSYQRVAPNLLELRIHVDLRARDLALLHRGAGPKEEKDWTVSRRTKLLRDDIAPPSERTVTVIFHHVGPGTIEEGSVLGEQVSQLLVCLPETTVALVTAPLAAGPKLTAAKGGTVMEKLVTAFAPTIEALDRVHGQALKTLTSLILRSATPSCVRSLSQITYPRLTTVGLPLSRDLFEKYLEPTDVDPLDEDNVRLDMMASATHRGLTDVLLLQGQPFAWKLLYHLKVAGYVRVSQETMLASWPHDFLQGRRERRRGAPRYDDDVFPAEEDLEQPPLRSFDEVDGGGRKRTAPRGVVTKRTKRARKM